MPNYTPILKLVQPDFDQTPWDEDVNNNFSILDAAYGKFISIPNLTGVWQNTTSYSAGQVVIDTADSSLWNCLVAHTSANTPTTFSQDRSAHPTYWQQIGTVLVYVPITGGTMTGPLGVSGPAGTSRQINSYTSASLRWTMTLAGNLAESGSNAGSDFGISRYDDAGHVIDQPLSITRSDGFLRLTHGVISPIFVLNNSMNINGDANKTVITMDIGNWHLQYERASGILHWIRGNDNVSLFSIDSVGNVIAKGTITQNGTPV